MRKTTPSFIAELPLRTTAADERTLAKRLDAARQIYNACLDEALKRLRLMRQSKDWQRARAMPRSLGKDAEGNRIPNPARTALYKAVTARFSFTSDSIQKHAEHTRDACWIGDHLGSHDAQTTSRRAFSAVQMHAFGKRGKPRYKQFGRFRSVEGKENMVLRHKVREGVHTVEWDGLVMPLMLDPKDRLGWQAEAMLARTKYVRIVRRQVKGRDRWYAQLVKQGLSPLVRPVQAGIAGLDIGPSSIAVVTKASASVEAFCSTVVQPWAEMRRLLRAMDRSRRATNPERFDTQGRFVRTGKPLVRSKRYQEVAAERRDVERRLASERRRSHGEHQNRMLAVATTIHTEDLSYKSFQKSFGRSTKVRAPGAYVSSLRRKAARAGGGMVDVRTRTTRLSQFDHTSLDYVKKPLKERMHVFRDGVTAPVQRDLYSAFLATCCGRDTLDVSQVIATWPGAEPLLRRATSGWLQRASGEGHARPHGREAVGARRPSKRDGRAREAGDAVGAGRSNARGREPRRAWEGTLRTPGL